MESFTILMAAAGRSARFGGPVNKLLQTLGDRPVLAWTLGAFAAREDVARIVVATFDAEAVGQAAKFLDPEHAGKIVCVPGGTCRAGSVLAAARAAAESCEWVAVHDAARPLVSAELITRTFAGAVQHGAAAAALGVHLTIKEAAGPLPAPVRRTLERQKLWAMQTPQAMRRKNLLAAFAACPIPLEEVTDDVQVLELSNMPVWLVEGEERNIKITTALDLRIAEALVG